eukprot:s8125_g5.t1
MGLLSCGICIHPYACLKSAAHLHFSPTMTGRRAACGAALAAGAFVAAPGFVTPAANAAAPRTAPHQQSHQTRRERADFSSGAAVGCASTVVLAAARRANKDTKTVRHFFGDSGGSSYASFDPATELGVQDPIGFWDPLGLSADKDQATFKRRRAVEIKHGRIAADSSRFEPTNIA